jgi:hypothetical protein
MVTALILSMSIAPKPDRERKLRANIDSDLLRQAYDPVLLAPIPANLIKSALELAEAIETRLASLENDLNKKSID